jgi:hypothetical protein
MSEGLVSLWKIEAGRGMLEVGMEKGDAFEWGPGRETGLADMGPVDIDPLLALARLAQLVVLS